MQALKLNVRCVLVLLVFSLSLLAHGRQPASHVVTRNVWPILMYDTDVGVGYGAKVFLLYTFGRTESFDVTVFNGTKGKRWYRFVCSRPDFECRQGTRYPLAIDFRADFDKDIKRSFFGIGSDALFTDREHYTREPFEAYLALSRGVRPRASARPR